MIYCGVAAYLLFVVFLGVRMGRKVGSFDDYLVAGRKMPLWVLVPTLVATWYGAGTCMGVSGMVYEGGVGRVIADPFGCALALVLAGVFFAGPLRKMRLLTITDVIRQAYGRRAEVFGSVLMLPFYIGTLAAQMVALGYLWQIVTGASMGTGIMVGSFVVLIYTMVGGMWSVAITDFAQLFFLILGLCLLVAKIPLSLDFALLKAESFALLPKRHGLGIYLGKLALVGLGGIMGQDLIQRFLSAKSPEVARQGSLLAAGIYLFLGCVPIAIGLASRHLHLTMPSEMLLLTLAKTYLNPALFTFFIVGLISAIMSTADSYLLAGSSLFVQNIFLRKNINAMRICSVVMALFAGALALYTQRIFDLIVHSGAFLCVVIFVPVLGALYKKSVRAIDGWVAMWAGLLGWLLCLLTMHKESTTDRLYLAALVGLCTSALGLWMPKWMPKWIRANTSTKHAEN